MIKKLYLPLLMVMVVAFSACKKLGALSPDYFTTTPQVLEAVAGKVPVTINGTFPEKYFKKKAVIEVTPVIRWEGGEVKGQPFLFQGEKVEGNDKTITYKTGGNYTMKTSFDYVPEMAKSELYLEFNAKVGKKTVKIPAVKIADGVIATSELLNNTLQNANPALGADAFQRIIKEQYDANIMFLIQQANVRANELKVAKAFNEEVKNISETERREITNIEVSAYASPDGGVSLNTTLAENRQGNTEKVINKNLKKSKLDVAVDANYTAQDWEGFQELVSKSNIQDKELILRVLSMYQDPEQREQEIKNISSVYKNLADEILPQLRRSRLTLNYNVIGKSDEEIATLADSDASQLNIEELLYAATLTNDNAKKTEIYKKAAKQFPNDFRAYNNLAFIAFQEGDFAQAEAYLNKAAAIENAPEVNMNKGLVALTKGDTAAAEAYLGKAAGVKELNEALGNLYIAQGQYERAVNAFGDTKTNSAALAQILAKDYNKAKNTLNNVERADAYTAYLTAILGARTNNESMVISNLKKAIAQDSSLAKYAATDLEFSKYFANSAFTALVK